MKTRLGRADFAWKTCQQWNRRTVLHLHEEPLRRVPPPLVGACERIDQDLRRGRAKLRPARLETGSGDNPVNAPLVLSGPDIELLRYRIAYPSRMFAHGAMHTDQTQRSLRSHRHV